MATKESTDTTDTLLALISLGFDIEECQALLEEGPCTVESAVEVLLSKRNPKTTRSTLASDASATPGKVKPDYTCETTKDTHLISRTSCSAEQERIKHEFWKREADIAAQNAKRRRMQDKMARESILNEIKADRMHRQELRVNATTSNDRNAISQPAGSCLHSQSNGSISQQTSGTCHVKVKLPSGRSVHHRFAKDNSILDVLSYFEDEYAGIQDITVLQPFPKHEFTMEERSKSLEELGLLPSTLFILLPRIDKVGHWSMSETNQREDKTTDPSVSLMISNNVSSGSEAHELGHGNIEAGESDAVIEPGHEGLNPAFRELVNSIMSSSRLSSAADENNIVEQREHGSDQDQDTEEVQGALAGEEAANVAEPFLDRNTVRGAAEQRLLRQLNLCAIASSSNARGACGLERALPSLQILCADCVALSLAGKKSQVLSSIGRLSPSSAEKVLQCLKKRKLLTGRIMNSFLSCKLQCFDLSFYSLTSNEILESARFHKTLTYLNLSNCGLITDSGLTTALKGLKNLRCVNLSDCSHITDKPLPLLAGLENLTSLNLDGTKITDTGFSGFLKNCNTESLSDVSLRRTNISDAGLACDREFCSVKSLKLDTTKISSLVFLSSFPKLEALSLSATLIKTESLESIQRNHLPISVLNLGNTEVSNEGLLHIRDLPLSSLTLPGRFKITDVALQYIRGLPLKSLDLTDFINITDNGIVYIGQIKSLQSLSLSNTKVTDDGLQYLADMNNLEDLNLDNLKITESGLQKIVGLFHLHTLSLSNSRITGEDLRVLNSFQNLNKLNLSRTTITDDHLKALRLPHLKSINLDRTLVSPLVKESLQGCPSLSVIRASGCENGRSGL